MCTIAWILSTQFAATTRFGPTRRRPEFTCTLSRADSAFSRPWPTYMTGLPLFKLAELRAALDDPLTDVVHFHNISLVGGPGVLGIGANRRAVRIMTAHEHWLVCPMHLLWKYYRKPCDGPSCVSCSLQALYGRPAQVWRNSRAIERAACWHLDALVFPSRHALEDASATWRHVGCTCRSFMFPYFPA